MNLIKGILQELQEYGQGEGKSAGEVKYYRASNNKKSLSPLGMKAKGD